MRGSKQAVTILMATPGMAVAHASDQAFVLLLPTDVYTAAGVASVALTVVLLALLPADMAGRLFRPVLLWRRPRAGGLRAATCLSALALLAGLIWAGLSGPRDPLANPMSLAVWSVWWIGLVSVQGLLGDLWRWINPWAGLSLLVGWAMGGRALMRYPRRLGRLPGLVLFLAFASLLLADPAPADPARLARIVAAYTGFTALALAVFGPVWLIRGEAITLVMRSYARHGIFGRGGARAAVGLPAWQVAAAGVPSLGAALFVLLLLGSGSFDGLNETFWWLGFLGINPLEFPGRSAVILQNLAGLVVANIALVVAFALCIWLGLRIARSDAGLAAAVSAFAPSILPIALGYHVAHYFATALVDAQYVYVALSDPLARGWDLLGIGQFYVTTGFFNTADTVRAIFLVQAGAVVIGHILAILVAHAQAVRWFGSGRQAVLSQAPLALFMIAYTWFGLWLLAAPRGA